MGKDIKIHLLEIVWGIVKVQCKVIKNTTSLLSVVNRTTCFGLLHVILLTTDNKLVVFLTTLHCTFMLHTQRGWLNSRLWRIVDWIDLFQDRGTWWAVMNGVLNTWGTHKMQGIFLTKSKTVSYWKWIPWFRFINLWQGSRHLLCSHQGSFYNLFQSWNESFTSTDVSNMTRRKDEWHV